MAAVIFACENGMWIYGPRTIEDHRKFVLPVTSVAVQYVHL